MNKPRRSAAQLKRTSERRSQVFDFMVERFAGRHLWTIDADAPDADEIFCFDCEGSQIIAITWLGAKGWSLYTEPTADAEYDAMESAIREQIEERQRGTDAPISGAHAASVLKGMLPRMSDEGFIALGQLMREEDDRRWRLSLEAFKAATIETPLSIVSPRVTQQTFAETQCKVTVPMPCAWPECECPKMEDRS